MVNAEGLKTWCLTWPKRAFLAGCLGGAVLGFIIALGEEADTSFDSWWLGLGVIIQLTLMVLAEAKEAWRRQTLTAAFAIFFYVSAALFEVAHQADEAGLDGLAFGYVCSIMACGFGWLVFAPPPSTSIAALKEHPTEVVLAALTVLGTFILWLDGAGLSLACQGGSSAFVFLTAVANDKTPVSAWLSQFVSTWVWLNAMGVWVASQDDTEVAGAFIIWLFTLLSSVVLGWKTMWGPAEDEKFDREISSVTGNKSGQALLLAFVFVLIGAPCTTSYDTGDETKPRDQEWYAAASFFVWLIVLCARQTKGGKRTWFMLWATSWLVNLTLINVSYGVVFDNLEESTPATGYAFLLMGNWLSFVSLWWVTPAQALAVVRPNGEKRGLFRSLGIVVAIFGTVLGIIAQMDSNTIGSFTPAPAFAWTSVVSLVFFLVSSAEGVPKLTLWVNLLWTSYFAFVLMDAVRQSDVDFDTAALFFMWLGWTILAFAALFFVEEPTAEDETPAVGETGVVPGAATPGALESGSATATAQPAASPAYDGSASAIPMGAPVEPTPTGSV